MRCRRPLDQPDRIQGIDEGRQGISRLPINKVLLAFGASARVSGPVRHRFRVAHPFGEHAVKLNNPELFRQQAYIDGQWLAADNAETITVTNPSTGVVIGQVPRMGKVETRRAIEAAERALPAWRQLSAKERGNKLRRWYELIIENQRDLALIMTLEQGKPFSEAIGEIAFGASNIEWYAEEAKRVYATLFPVRRTSACWSSNNLSVFAPPSHPGTSLAR